MYTINDFFCGAGGMGLGFKKAGFHINMAYDFDKNAVATYKANVDEKVVLSDVSKMKWNDIPKADVWAFGFPCQDISVAGKQKGIIKGVTRSGLLYEMVRLLQDTKQKDINSMPEVLVIENVKELKKYMYLLEKEFGELGYKIKYKQLDSNDFGVPQKRERIFVVATLGKKDFNFTEKDALHIPLFNVIEKEVDERYFLNKEDSEKIIEQAKQKVKLTGLHACITPKRINKRQNGRRAKNYGEPMYTLTTQDKHGIIFLDGEDYKVRVLTEKECCLLQGFPNDFKKVVSNSAIYKQMGNAVTVNVAEYVAGEVFRYLESGE